MWEDSPIARRAPTYGHVRDEGPIRPVVPNHPMTKGEEVRDLYRKTDLSQFY
jgi:hypothetical protein